MLIILILSVFAQEAWPAAPELLLSSSDGGWRDPVYSADGQFIAFTNSAQNRIYVLERGQTAPRSVARGDSIGRRFAFEPGAERIVFRLRSYALPGKPERLISSSIYLYDPVHHTENTAGDLFGPYLIVGRIWYRYSLLGPFFDYDGQIRGAGPYWDAETGKLNVLNAALDTVFTSGLKQRIAGYEISPDGGWLAAVESRPERRVLLIRIEDGTNLSVPLAIAPNWAGNSQSVICVTDSSLRIVRVPSGESEVVLSSPRFRPETPALNLDGSRALFVSEGALYEMTLP